MALLDQLSNVLKQYTGGSNQNLANVSEHFDQVAQAAPQGTIAEGLSDVFRSNQTPAFGSLVGNLFNQSNGEQKAGVLNHLIGSLGPGALSQVAGGGALANLLGGGEDRLLRNRPRTSLPSLSNGWLLMQRRLIPRLSTGRALSTPGIRPW